MLYSFRYFIHKLNKQAKNSSQKSFSLLVKIFIRPMFNFLSYNHIYPINLLPITKLRNIDENQHRNLNLSFVSF